MAFNHQLVWTPPSAVSYSTTFAANESPISEGGVWLHTNPWFKNVATTGGRAYGLQPNPSVTDGSGPRYEDGYAYLNGVWTPNQYASGHIHKDASVNGYLEVELLLRWSDSYNSGTGVGITQGYECFVHRNGEYITVMRWKGNPLTSYARYPADFDLLGEVLGITPPNHGDLFEAQIVGNIITVKLAGVTYLTVDVSSGGRTPIAGGAPGIGFDAGASGAETANDTFGFQDFYATTL